MGETNFRTQEIPRSGSKAKDGEKKREKERKRERAKVGDNNGQATYGARKHAWRTQAAWANIFKAKNLIGQLWLSIILLPVSKEDNICRNTLMDIFKNIFHFQIMKFALLMK